MLVSMRLPVISLHENHRHLGIVWLIGGGCCVPSRLRLLLGPSQGPVCVMSSTFCSDFNYASLPRQKEHTAPAGTSTAPMASPARALGLALLPP